MSRAVKLAVNQVIHDLEHRAEDFKCSEYQLIDTKTGLEYWIANGSAFAKIDNPYELSFGWWHGTRFMVAVDKWKAYEAIRRAIE